MANVTEMKREGDVVVARARTRRSIERSYVLEQIFELDFFDFGNHFRVITEITFGSTSNVTESSFSTRERSVICTCVSHTGLVYLASELAISDLARTSERPLPAFCF